MRLGWLPQDLPFFGEGDAIRPLRRLLLALTLTLGLVLLIGALASWRGHRAELQAELGHSAGIMAERVARRLAVQAVMAAAVDSLLNGQDGTALLQEEPALHQRLQRLRALTSMQDVLVLDREGRALVSAGSFPVPSGQDFSDRPWFRAARETAAGVTVGLERIAGTGRMAFPLAYPRLVAGEFAGVIALAAEPTLFAEALGAHPSALRGFRARLLQGDGTVLARHGHLPEAVPESGSGGFRQWRPVAGQPLRVEVAVDAGELASRWLRSMVAFLLIGLPVTAALLGTTLLALRRARLAAAAEQAWRAEAGLRQAAEAQLARAQRLESLGQLTGGVAHDFNNLLQVIVSGLAVLSRRPQPDRQAAALEAMHQAAIRGGRLTRQLLAFARRQALAPASLDLSSRIAGMRELLERSLRQDITLCLDLADGLWPLKADATQLEVAILNLAVNARDAMPRGGTLTISARNQCLQGEGKDRLAGDFIRITVRDTGHGMAPEILARIFEPFFTTKLQGQGTGLGLAQAYGFARQSGGMALAESSPGEGTAVHLLLPRAEAMPEPEPDEERLAEPDPQPMRQLRVLVVEDDEEVGALASELLHQLGHLANRVRTADAALGALAEGRPIDLLFTDVVMPGLRDGLDLVAEARRRRPELPVLVTSGYAGAAARVALAGLPLLRKPYGPEELRAAIKAALAEPAREEDGAVGPAKGVTIPA